MDMNLRALCASLRTRMRAPRGTGKEMPAATGAPEVRTTGMVDTPRSIGPGSEAPGVVMESRSHVSSNVCDSTPGADKALTRATLKQLFESEAELTLQALKLSPENSRQAKAGDVAVSPPEPEEKLSVQTMKVTPEQDPVPVAPSGATPGPTARANDDGEKKPKPDNVISNIFTREDEETKPLANLTAALPDVSAAELLVEARELLVALGEWRSNQSHKV